ncbi:MAG: hypothetical protein Q4D90_01500 [bacterium]|nr:hypothetical protein [bacterium]
MEHDKKIILVSHGKLAEGMLHSIQMIVGEHKELSCMGMMPGEHYQSMVDAIEQSVKEHPETQHLIVADLLGGSVCNGMSILTTYPNVKLIAGMNMGLVIELLLNPQVLSDEEIDRVIQMAKDMNKRVVLEKDANEGEEAFF